MNQYYIDMSGGITKDVTESSAVPFGLSFKELNLYINSLKSFFLFDKEDKKTSKIISYRHILI